MTNADRLEEVIRREIHTEGEIERLNDELAGLRRHKRRIEREWLEEREVAASSLAFREVGRQTGPPISSNNSSGAVPPGPPNITVGPLTDAVERLLTASTKPMKPHQIASILRAAGREEPEPSIQTTLSNLVKKNRITRIGHGSYEGRAGRELQPLLPQVEAHSGSQTDVDRYGDPDVTVS